MLFPEEKTAPGSSGSPVCLSGEGEGVIQAVFVMSSRPVYRIIERVHYVTAEGATRCSELCIMVNYLSQAVEILCRNTASLIVWDNSGTLFNGLCIVSKSDIIHFKLLLCIQYNIKIGFLV